MNSKVKKENQTRLEDSNW